MGMGVRGYSEDSFITSFSDSLQTAGGLSSDWLQFNIGFNPVTDPVGSTFASIGPTSFDGANGLTWGLIGSGSPVNTWWRNVCMPVRGGFYNGVFGKSQFVQCRVLKVTGNYNNSAGIITNISQYGTATPGLTCYIFTFTGTGQANWMLRRANADVYSTLLTGTDTINAADDLRLSSDQSISGQVTLTVKRNGAVLGSIADVSASRLITGIPGLSALLGDTNAANKNEWRLFSAGVGL